MAKASSILCCNCWYFPPFSTQWFKKSLDFNRFFLIFALGNLLMLANGTTLGWFGFASAKLASSDTPLVTGPLTPHEVSWIAAINSIGAMCGSLTFGFIASGMGSKRAMIFLALPISVFWVLIYFGNAYHHILLARYLHLNQTLFSNAL